MATFDGKNIRGLVGGVVFRKGKGNDIIQSGPEKVKQTAATIVAGKVFGQGSILAALIRRTLSGVTLENYDGSMINRFASPVRDVLKQCLNKETGQYAFEQDSFIRLEGFEFNTKSLLINSLLVAPETSLNGNILKVSLPEIEVPQKFKFPESTNVCTLTIGLSVIALHAGLHLDLPDRELEITNNDHTVPASEFEFEVSEGCLCVAAISLKYFKLNKDIKTVFNSKSFHPAAICGAIVTPGTFIVPPPFIKEGNKTIPTKWRSGDKIKLPPADGPSAQE